jgi:hypothetical protein
VNQMLLRRGFTNLYFSGAVVMDPPFQAVIMDQTEYSTASENLDGHAQWKKLHFLLLHSPLGKKKKKKKKRKKES